MELSEIVRRRNELEELDKITETEEDKNALIENISTKLKTSFIGALAAFENNFGYLWGHNSLKLTVEQKELRDKWKLVRKEILDKGNDQIKYAKLEFGKYEIKNVGYKVEFEHMGGDSYFFKD